MFAGGGTTAGALAAGGLAAGLGGLFAGPLSEGLVPVFAEAPGLVGAFGAAWAPVTGDGASALAAEHPKAALAATSNVYIDRGNSTDPRR